MACRRGDLKGEAARIRAALAMGYSVAAVARLYGCTPHAVERIRDGTAHSETPKKRGPKPAVREEAEGAASVGEEVRARLQRALAHWRKNPDMELSEVADMYGVDRQSLDHARARSEGRHP